jgi:hypothetical protein
MMTIANVAPALFDADSNVTVVDDENQSALRQSNTATKTSMANMSAAPIRSRTSRIRFPVPRGKPPGDLIV